MFPEKEVSTKFAAYMVPEAETAVVEAYGVLSFVPSQVRFAEPPESNAGVPAVEVQKGIRPDVSADEVATADDPPPEELGVVQVKTPAAVTDETKSPEVQVFAVMSEKSMPFVAAETTPEAPLSTPESVPTVSPANEGDEAVVRFWPVLNASCVSPILSPVIDTTEGLAPMRTGELDIVI